MDTKQLFGILAAIIVLCGTLPYLRDIFLKKTKPSRATWSLLTLLMMINLLIQRDIGVGWSLLLTAGEVTATTSIFFLSLKYGVGGFQKLELVCYIFWATMVVLWLKLDRPLLALHFGLAADLISMVPTFIKSWKKPKEESANVFVASGIAALCGAIAVSHYQYEELLLPGYLFLVNITVVVILHKAHRRIASRKKAPKRHYHKKRYA